MRHDMIDRDFLIQVKDYMVVLERPVRKLIDNDGTILPLITVEVGLWTI